MSGRSNILDKASLTWWTVLDNASALSLTTHIARTTLAATPSSRDAEFTLDPEASSYGPRLCGSLWHGPKTFQEQPLRQPIFASGYRSWEDKGNAGLRGYCGSRDNNAAGPLRRTISTVHCCGQATAVEASL
jgi:hypothetical protein